MANPPIYVNGFIMPMILCKTESHHHDASQYFHLNK